MKDFNIISPIFVDHFLDFKHKDFINLNDIKINKGGVELLTYFFNHLNWILPSSLNREYNDYINAYFVDVGDGVKRTAIDYKKFKISFDLNFVHLMYGDYFEIINSGNSIISIDFCGLGKIEDINRFLNQKNIKYIFCSDHDLWAKDEFLIDKSFNRYIFWHSPRLVKIFHNKSMSMIDNKFFSSNNKRINVGVGDFFAINILNNFYKSKKSNYKIDEIISFVEETTNLISNKFFYD